MTASLANLLFPADWEVPDTLQARPGTAATEKAAQQLVASEIQTDLQSVDCLQGTGETSADLPMATYAQLT